MQCKHVREMILTDYTDNELSQKQSDEIRAHITNCRACFDFQKQVQQKTVIPLTCADSHKAPDYMWQKISEAVQGNQTKKKTLRFPEIFLECACAVAVIVCIFSFVSLLNNTQYAQSTETNYTSYLANDTLKQNATEQLYLYY